MNIRKYIEHTATNEAFHEKVGWWLNSALSAILGCLFAVLFRNPTNIIFALSIILLFGLTLSYIVYVGSSTFNLLKILKRDQKKGNWREIIRIAYPLSRPLWLSRNYKLRVELGRLIEDACIHLSASSINNVVVNDTTVSIKSIRSSILIDDLGWTLYKISNRHFEQAKDNIQKGISIALEQQHFSKVIKGYRHLSGMSRELGLPNNIINEYQQKIVTLINDVTYSTSTPEHEQQATKAALYYSFAKDKIGAAQNENDTEKKQQILTEALSHIGFSETFFKENDPSRYAKTFCVRAEINIMLGGIGNLNSAIDLLKEGLIFCKDEQRRDNYIRISIMLLKAEIKRTQLRSYHGDELNIIKRSAKEVYQGVMGELSNSEDDNDYRREVKALIKEIKRIK